MQILLDQGVYDMRNKGNVALFQTAAARLNRAWPGASLKVITSAPYLLKLYCPEARPVSPDGNDDWLESHSLLSDITWRIPTPLLRLLFELREEMWRRWPDAGSQISNLKKLKSLLRAQGVKQQMAPATNGHKTFTQPATATRVVATAGEPFTFKALKGVDLFVATGAQYMADACRDDALRVLDRLEAAHRLGIPTAMVGQGIGPIADPQLQDRAKAVLPQVDLILIRERFATLELLKALGVDAKRVIFTSDDAIEMAYQARSKALGTGIGVSMRVAPYTQIGESQLALVRPILDQASAQYKAKLIAVPISHSAHELDDRILRELLAGQTNAVHNPWRFEPPLGLIKRVGRCRIVITGTFHTAVFALSQGIPAVALAKSTMYMDKFIGLADQFGSAGCQALYLGDTNLTEKLASAIDTAWKTAEQVRPQLLEAATRQIALGHAGYQQIYELVEAKKQVRQQSAEKELA